jgi:hypothetical protein
LRSVARSSSPCRAISPVLQDPAWGSAQEGANGDNIAAQFLGAGGNIKDRFTPQEYSNCGRKHPQFFHRSGFVPI